MKGDNDEGHDNDPDDDRIASLRHFGLLEAMTGDHEDRFGVVYERGEKVLHAFALAGAGIMEDEVAFLDLRFVFSQSQVAGIAIRYPLLGRHPSSFCTGDLS